MISRTFRPLRAAMSRRAVVLIPIVALGVIGCEKVPLLAPTGSTITLTSATTALPINGTATIVAQVLESSGTPPHSGTRVSFTTTLGTIEPVDASTDVSGRATVTFKAGSASGTAIISAISGGATTSNGSSSSGGTGGAGGTNTGDRSLRIAVGAAAVGRVVLGASPATVSSRGGSTTLTAAVTDINGNPLGSIPVIFTTTAGTLAATSVITDAAGVAVTSLSTSVDATVTASAGIGSGSGGGSTGGGAGGAAGGGGSSATSATVSIKVNPTPTLSVTPATAGQSTAGTPIVFTVTATIPAGSTAQIRDMSIDFGDGTVRPLGAATGTTSVQHVYNNTSIQSYTVTVTLTDTLGERTSASTVVVVLPQPPLGATIGFTKSGALPSVTVSFTATVTPATATVTSYFWDFGNGASQTTTANTTVQTYNAAGTFTVRVTVTTTTGQTTTGVTAVPIP